MVTCTRSYTVAFSHDSSGAIDCSFFRVTCFGRVIATSVSERAFLSHGGNPCSPQQSVNSGGATREDGGRGFSAAIFSSLSLLLCIIGIDLHLWICPMHIATVHPGHRKCYEVSSEVIAYKFNLIFDPLEWHLRS